MLKAGVFDQFTVTVTGSAWVIEIVSIQKNISEGFTVTTVMATVVS
jgi:hypothetical protein